MNTVDARILDGGVVAVFVEGWQPSKKQKPIAMCLMDSPFIIVELNAD